MKEDVEASGVHVLQEDIKALIIKDGAVKGVKAASGKKNTVGQRYRSLRRAVLSWNRLNRRRISVSEAGWTYDRSAPALPGAFGLPGKLVPGGARPFLAEYCGSGDRSETRKRNLPGFRRNAFYTLWRQRSGHIKRQRSYEDLAPERYEIHIDLKPGLNFEQLDLRLQRDFQKFQNRDFSNSLQELLPKKLIPVAVNLSGIPGEKKCHQISRQERMNFGRSAEISAGDNFQISPY